MRVKKKVLGFESGKEMCEPENTHLVAELVRACVMTSEVKEAGIC